MDKILKRYKNRLVNINSNNRSLYLRKIDQKQNFDLWQTKQFYPELIEEIYQKIIQREAGRIQLFPDMIEFQHRLEQKFHRHIQAEQNDALSDLNTQQQTLGVEAYTARWEAIEQHAKQQREQVKRELANAVKIIETQQKRLAVLHRECIALEKETGRYELSIGYPFIKGKFLDGTPVHAPLFLFTVQLERGANNTWFLIFNQQPPTINRVFLLAVQKYNQTPIALDVIEKFAVDKVDLTSEHLYRQLLRQFSLHIDWQDIELQPFPTKIELEQQIKETITGSFKIEHHLVLGNFPIANSLYYDYEKMQRLQHMPKSIEHLFKAQTQAANQIDSLPLSQQFFLTMVDESQERAISLTEQKPYTVIYGPPGTGKSQTIAAIVGQAIANQKKVLIVSHKKAALDVLYNRIHSLQDQAMLVHQPSMQSEQFFQKVTYALEQPEFHVQVGDLHKQLYNCNQQIATILQSFEAIKQFLYTQQDIGLTMQQMYEQSSPIHMRRDHRYDLMRFWQLAHDQKPLTFDQSVQLQTKFQQFSFITKAFQARQMKENPYVPVLASVSTQQQVQAESQFQLMLNFFNGIKPECGTHNTKNSEWNLKYWSQIAHVSHSVEEFYEQIQVQKQALVQRYEAYVEQLAYLETLLPKAYWEQITTSLEQGNYDQLCIYFNQLDEAFELLGAYEQLTAEFKKLSQDEITFLDSVIRVFDDEAKAKSFVQSLPELLILQTVRQKEANCQVIETMEQFSLLQKQAQYLLREKQKIVQAYLIAYQKQAIQTYRQQYPQECESLYHQVTKQRATTTIRESIHQYYDAYTTLFPCWLASPETIADIFPFEADLFDIILFDEASQLAAEQTLPVFYRGKKIVVVGDEQQLKPPQTFLLKYDDDMNEGEHDVVYTVESILDLAKLKYPSVKLNHHYRSQASELIAFSNAAFYENELLVTTDVQQRNATHPPIQRLKVAGIWKEQVNLAEAYEVVALVVNLLSTKASTETLGVITFNSKQKDLILDLLEQYTQEDEVFAKQYFIEQERFEQGEDVSFFVKNIENVQGDERDLIIFSTAYAPNSQGKMSMNFGSLSQEGGENRLNVAITRARKQIYVVTSIEPEQLEVEQTKFAGAKLLKAYLTYVRAISTQNTIEKEKVLRQLQTQRHNQRVQPKTSTFAKQLALNLEMRGFEVHKNLGEKMYHYDLAIYDAKSERYILGIECDTPQNEPFVVKHREVVKQAILAQFGWHTLRVWSRDWWLNPDKVLAKIEQRIEEITMECEVNEPTQ
ncbi:MAG: AAA domain-containing protein [Culicoidibacterales bacterium]